MRRAFHLVTSAALLAFALVPAGAALQSPAVLAASSTYTVTADMPSANPAGHNWEFTDYFPRSLRVTQGDTVQFAIEGFHTATLLPAGITPRADFQAHNGVATVDRDDGRNPGGQLAASLNVRALSPAPASCGYAPAPACTFDGRSVVNASPFGPQAPFAVTITAAPGTYWFHCRIHPGMNGRITVVPVGQSTTTTVQAAAETARQLKTDVQQGWAAWHAANHVTVIPNANGTRTLVANAGTASANGKVNILEMLPAHIWADAGDRVVWRSPSWNEVHTVTFPTDLGSDLVPVCPGDTPATPVHTPPQGPTDFSCSGGTPPSEIHVAPGNGVRTLKSPSTVSDSGLLAPAIGMRLLGLPAGVALPRWWVSTSSAADGTYRYVCQIHGPAMSGTITVY